MSILTDTSYFVALVNTKDKNHPRVVDFTRHLREPLILPQPVLPEVCYLLATRLGHSVMRRFIAEVAASSIEIETVTHEDLRRVAEVQYTF